jgi:hypothetical protein
MSYQQGRRRRRRRILVVLASIAVIAVVAYAVTRVASESQLRREYLDQALAFAQGESDLATRLADMVDRLEELGRPGMLAVLDELQQESAALARDLADARMPSGDLEKGALYLQIAAERWRDGISYMRQGLLSLSQTALDPGGEALLAQGLVDLSVGDSAFSSVLGLARAGETSELGQDFPEVAFVPSSSAAAYAAADLAQRLGNTPGLAVQEDLSVADLRLDPGPLGEQLGLPVIPVSDDLTAQVTVANHGTVPAVNIAVVLHLYGDGTDDRMDQTIALLQPGALTTVTFDGLPAEPGKLYQVVVSLDVQDEDASNDTVRFTFIRNTAA